MLCVRLTAIAFLLASLRVAQAEQYPHEFAGQLDGGGRISCVQYFVLRQEAQPCVQLTSSAPSIQGEVCSTVAGPLLAVYSPAADRNLFTARLVGPQVQMLPLTGCQVTDREEREEKARDCDDSDPEHESVVYGLMSGLLPGLYRLEVQWLYTGFSYGKDKVRKDMAHPPDYLAHGASACTTIAVLSLPQAPIHIGSCGLRTAVPPADT